MKVLGIPFLIIGLTFSVVAQNSISVAGLGRISYLEEGDGYSLDIEDFGQFKFQGSLKPLNLETNISQDQLLNFPGYDIIKELELEELNLKLTSDSFILYGRADTKKSLHPLCEAFNIQEPYINFTAQLSSNKMKLMGELDFLKSPIVQDISTQTGTRFTLKKTQLYSEVALGKKNTLTLGIKNLLMIRPTSYDSDLKTVMDLSYDLVTTEITGTGAMNDNWVDPLGMSHYLDIEKNAVSFSNTLLSLGWIPGSSVPTTIAFSTEKAKFFETEYKTAVQVAPLEGKLALKAYRNELEVNDFVKMLKDGFGLKFSENIFPKDLLIKEVDLLFSPNGGKVKNVKIAKGFLFKGGLKFSDTNSGDVNFYTNAKDSLYINMEMNTDDFYQYLTEKINTDKDSKINKALRNALSSLQIKKIFLHLEADKDNNLNGATDCQLIIFGKEMNFSLNETFNPNKILNNLILKLGKIALEQADKETKK